MDVISGDYLEILHNIFEGKKARNSRYSLRSFARDLGLAPGTLSAILNGKRALTEEKAAELSLALNLSGDKREHFLEAVARAEAHRRSPTESGLRKIQEKFKFLKLRSDQLSFISEWHHLGLLNLIKSKKFKNDPEWMAAQLGITTVKVKQGLARLRRLKLTFDNEEGRLCRTNNPIETPTDIPSQHIRSFHKSVMKRALVSLEADDIHERDISSIMVCTSQEKLIEAKKRIRLFRKELAAFLEEDGGDQVYSLNVQLFPQSSDKGESP